MKRVLLITYYFPPCGGASVQRWLRLLPYFAKNGYLFTVITTSNGDYPLYDETLCSKIPAEVNVIRTKTPTLSSLFAKLTGSKQGLPHGSLTPRKEASLATKIGYWLRINCIAPDMRIIWNRYALSSAIKEVRSRKYDLIITTGPPHSTHLVGKQLKKLFPLKWIADFRDPWSEINYLQLAKQNCIIRLINKKLEESVLKKADLNLIVSQTIADSLPSGNKRILYNGFDPQDFANLRSERKQIDSSQPNKALRVKYVGAIRTGHPIKQVLEWLKEAVENKFIDSIELSFIGSFDIPPASELLKIRNIKHTSHQNALKEMIDADILILLIRKSPNNKGILTTKLFEYIATGNFILAIGPTDGEAASILANSNAGKMFAYDDKEGFIEELVRQYERIKAGNFQLEEKNISQYSAPEQVKELTSIFDTLITQ